MNYFYITVLCLFFLVVGAAIQDTINVYDRYIEEVSKTMEPITNYTSSTAPLVQVIKELVDEKQQCKYEKDYWYDQFESNCK